VGIVVFVIIFACFIGIKVPGTSGGWGENCLELVYAAITLVVLAALGGTSCIRLSAKGVGYAFHKLLYVLIWLAVIAFIVFLSGYAMSSKDGASPIRPDWTMQLLINIVLCIGIGIFEECLCRGILFGSLLAKMGSTHRGIVWAIVISSVVFGFMHTVPYFLKGTVITLAAWAQVVTKTFDAGVFGALMALLYLRTRNIWSIAAIHCLNDLLPLVAMSVVSNPFTVTYVSNDAQSASNSLVYTVVMFLVVYLPVLLKLARDFRASTPLPQMGPFVEDWEARKPDASLESREKGKERKETA